MASKRKSAHRRTRNGCERCKQQHRKCDERKPKCSRCVVVSADCRYVAQVGFKQDNVQSLRDQLGDRQGEELGYEKVHFVEEPDLLTKTCGGSSNESVAPVKVTSDDKPNGSSKTADITKESIIERPNQQNFDAGERNWPLVGRSPLSDAEVGLMKHYCAHIAPWLDVYDQQQPFTTLVPHMAMNSPFMLQSLLLLAAASKGLPSSTVTRREGVGFLHMKFMMIPPGKESPFLAVRALTAFAFSKLAQMMQTKPEEWESIFNKGSTFPDWYPGLCEYDEGEGHVWRGFLLLICRLETGYCIVKKRQAEHISTLLQRLLAQQECCVTANTNQVLTHSIRCLWLLARTLSLVYPLESSRITRPTPSDMPSKQHESSSLIQELQDWSLNRALPLKPLSDQSEISATTPTQGTKGETTTFTTAAGIATTILFHATSFILHERVDVSEPIVSVRTLSPTDTQPISPAVWHAQRIFEVVRDNDTVQTIKLDPCILASLDIVTRQEMSGHGHHSIMELMGSM